MSQSATYKVFATISLLERILICLAENNVHSQHPWKWPRLPEQGSPAQPLFILQRVCNGFKSTIHQSDTLKQFMFLAIRQSSREEHWSRKKRLATTAAPVLWLFNQLKQQPQVTDLAHTTESKDDDQIIRIHLRRCLLAGSRWYIARIFSDDAKSRMSSWRNMIACHLPVQRLEFRLLIRFIGERPPKLRLFSYYESLHFGGDATLGDVLDRFVEVMRRTSEQHRVACKAWEPPEKSGEVCRRLRKATPSRIEGDTGVSVPCALMEYSDTNVRNVAGFDGALNFPSNLG